jgi:hypothetical protein
MAQQNYLQEYIDQHTSFLSSVVLEPICAWFKEHPGEEISVEKLMDVLKLPKPATISTPRGRATATNQSLASAAPKRTRSTKSTSDRPQCKWTFMKGDNKGKQCPARAAEGSEYCTACSKKKSIGGTGRKSSSASESKSKTGSKASAGAAKKGLTATAKSEPKKEDVEYEISVDEFGTSTEGHALVIDSGSGYILKEADEETYTIVGICDDEEAKTMRPLTAAEKKKAATLLGLDIEDGVTMA